MRPERRERTLRRLGSLRGVEKSATRQHTFDCMPALYHSVTLIEPTHGQTWPDGDDSTAERSSDPSDQKVKNCIDNEKETSHMSGGGEYCQLYPEIVNKDYDLMQSSAVYLRENISKPINKVTIQVTVLVPRWIYIHCIVSGESQLRNARALSHGIDKLCLCRAESFDINLRMHQCGSLKWASDTFLCPSNYGNLSDNDGTLKGHHLFRENR